MGDLSCHFSAVEFVDRRQDVRHDPPCRLIAVLEVLRHQKGRPLHIVSGYRTPETNALVGGAANSRHMHADAVDIPAGYCTVEEAEAAGAVGIGADGKWAIHLDVRPGPPARWRY